MSWDSRDTAISKIANIDDTKHTRMHLLQHETTCSDNNIFIEIKDIIQANSLSPVYAFLYEFRKLFLAWNL